MRYSKSRPLSVTPIAAGSKTETFVRRIERSSNEEARQGGVLFIGGNTPADLLIRQAQGALRFDRLPSYWSHTAIIVSWPDGAGLDRIVGAEVALPCFEDPLFAPERNGATLFRLSKYADSKHYPNMAFATLTPREAPRDGPRKGDDKPDGATPRLDKSLLLKAALEPNRERIRYRLWDWLGAWSNYVLTGPSAESPLVQSIPYPGAAFCEYVYEAAGLDLTPGASEPNACPELLWATLRYWYRALGAEKIADLHAWSRLGDPESPTRKTCGVTLWSDYRAAIRDTKRAKPRRKQSRKKRTK